MNNKLRNVRDIIKYYSNPRVDRDTPDSFYSWEETQVMMKNIITKNASSKSTKNLLTSSVQSPYELIDNAADLKIALKPFQEAKIIGIDCETALGTDHTEPKFAWYS